MLRVKGSCFPKRNAAEPKQIMLGRWAWWWCVELYPKAYGRGVGTWWSWRFLPTQGILWTFMVKCRTSGFCFHVSQVAARTPPLCGTTVTVTSCVSRTPLSKLAKSLCFSLFFLANGVILYPGRGYSLDMHCLAGVVCCREVIFSENELCCLWLQFCGIVASECWVLLLSYSDRQMKEMLQSSG